MQNNNCMQGTLHHRKKTYLGACPVVGSAYNISCKMNTLYWGLNDDIPIGSHYAPERSGNLLATIAADWRKQGIPSIIG